MRARPMSSLYYVVAPIWFTPELSAGASQLSAISPPEPLKLMAPLEPRHNLRGYPVLLV
jgi:hypothetical protein